MMKKSKRGADKPKRDAIKASGIITYLLTIVAIILAAIVVVLLFTPTIGDIQYTPMIQR